MFVKFYRGIIVYIKIIENKNEYNEIIKMRSILEKNCKQLSKLMFADYYNNSSGDCVVRGIFSEENILQGLIALFYMDNEDKTAELEIALSEKAYGKGYAWFGMQKILKLGFEKYGLEKIYWCVAINNIAALRFFNKHNFGVLDYDVPISYKNRHDNEGERVWFTVYNGDDFANEQVGDDLLEGCKLIRIKTIPTIEAGQLSFFENGADVNFAFQRIYYITKVNEGIRRGGHAHKKLKQVLFCPYGEIMITLDDGISRKEIILRDPSFGLVIEDNIWREMVWLKSDSVLVVAASEKYDPNDYIRDYSEFLKYKRINNE